VMPLRLESDFRDWYDHAFSSQGTPFERLSTGGMSRREMFPYLESLGLEPPRHGTVSAVAAELLEEWPEESRASAAEQMISLVVYLDLWAHSGEGKVRVSAADALLLYPDRYCSEFMSATTSGGAGRSLRYLQVGNRQWHLMYWSDHDWRSNYGEGGVKVLEESPLGYHPTVTEPMFAIDFLLIGQKLLAVDFNTAPGLAPLRGLVTPSEIVGLLGAAIERAGTEHNKGEYL